MCESTALNFMFYSLSAAAILAAVFFIFAMIDVVRRW